MVKTRTATSWLGFVTTEWYRNDAAAVNDTLKKLAKDVGATGAYHGIQVEDPEYGYLIPIWPSTDTRTAFRAGNTKTETLTALADKAGMSGDIMGVDFHSDPQPIFDAPVTEIMLIELKTIDEKEGAGKVLDELVAIEGPGYLGGTWGETDRDDGQLVMVIGWESLTAHRIAIESGNEDMVRLLRGLAESAVWKVNHSKLIKAV